ncbi:MAG: VCBS repeat-containing protein [Planctomycetes bacterium]|nr:VCBS repeat-containing protein [Planctomycetota bacterium]
MNFSITILPVFLLLVFLTAASPRGGAQETPEFGPPETIAAGVLATQFADINNDGRLDLVSGAGCQLAIAGGGFEAMLPFSPSLGRLQIGDVDGDGRVDLVGTLTMQTFGVHFGDGLGHFSPGGVIATIPSTPAGARLLDLDEDGALDLFVCAAHFSAYSYSDARNWIFRGDGHGIFTIVSNAAASNFAVDFGDFNADGHLDWVASWWNHDGIEVDLGDGAMGASQIVNFNAGQYGTVDAAMGDLDGDGLGDIALAFHDYYIPPDPDAIGIVSNTGSLQLWHPAAPPMHVTIRDLNGDGMPELLTNDGSSAMFVNINFGNFAFSQPLALAAWPFAGLVDAADANGDGKPDLVLSQFAAPPNAGSTFVLSNALAKPLPWIPYIHDISPRGSPVAAMPAPALTIRGEGLAGVFVATIGANIYEWSSLQPGGDGNTLAVRLVPPPAAGPALVTVVNPAGAAAPLSIPFWRAPRPVMYMDPPQPAAGRPVILYFAGPRPGDLVLSAAGDCLESLALPPYVTFDIGGCGGIEWLPSPPPMNESGWTSLQTIVPADFHGIAYIQFCDVNLAALRSGMLPLFTSNVLALALP